MTRLTLRAAFAGGLAVAHRRPTARGPAAAFAFAPLFALAPHAFAQTAAPPAALPGVVVTGNPLGAADVAAPVSTLGGDELTLRRGTTLGDTLNGLPGVSSTWFGPNANRPVIRGLDGDRVRLLGNGGASFDASALSYDHALPIDPLAVERIEVLRGPGALLYGGSAVGGVVNAIDNRIPKRRLQGAGGAAEVRLGGAESERAAAALIEAGNGRYALHVDAFDRSTSDLRVPRHVPVEQGTPLPETTRVRNSASRTRGGAVGGSLTFARGHLGVSADTHDSRYGSVAEEDTTIRMKRDRYALAGEAKGLPGVIRAVRGQLHRSLYAHREIDGAGAVGTTFLTRGTEARLEAEHAPLGMLRGVVGVQLERFDFSALGEEAFVPGTRTRRNALFALEELKWREGMLTAGARIEHAKVDSAGDADGSTAKFGAPAQRGFGLRSFSLAHVADIAAEWKLSAGWSHTERAPTFYELYANGRHVATAAFEVGDPALQKERGRNVDIGLQWKRGASSARIGAFVNRFSNYIALEATGAAADDGSGAALPVYGFRGVRARLAGVEVEARRRLLDAGWGWDATAKLDHVRATNLDTGEPLPRVAPLRALLGVEARSAVWQARAEVDHAARQDRVPATDTATAGYTLVNFSLARNLEVGGARALAFVKLTNAGDRLAYSASTVQTVRGLAPLPGRALKVGLRIGF